MNQEYTYKYIGNLRIVDDQGTEKQMEYATTANTFMNLSAALELQNKLNPESKSFKALREFICIKPDYWRNVEKLILDKIDSYADESNQENYNFTDNDVCFGTLHFLKALYQHTIQLGVTSVNIGKVNELLGEMETVREKTLTATEEQFNINPDIK